jgi:hypothetical protein
MEEQRDPKTAIEGKTWEKNEEREATYEMD